MAPPNRHRKDAYGSPGPSRPTKHTGLRRVPYRTRDLDSPRSDTPISDAVDTTTAYRKALESRLLAERAATRELELEIAELKRAQPPAPLDPTPSAVQALITRLLAANDASLPSTLPAAPKFAPTADPSIPSALPLPVADPLPQLRAFSTLTFSTATTTPLPNLRQRYEIRGYAGVYGVGVLDFAVDMVVDHERERVAELTARVSPWAQRELRVWIAGCERTCDVQGLLYAIDVYHRLCVRRAKVFCRLAAKYPQLARGSGRKWWGWLGTAVMVLTGGKVQVVVQWQVRIDDVGEARSEVGALLRVPGLFVEMDEEDSLSRVGALFRDLVEERGIAGAVAVVVELFFGERE